LGDEHWLLSEETIFWGNGTAVYLDLWLHRCCQYLPHYLSVSISSYIN
jgi:hypothetical protein